MMAFSKNVYFNGALCWDCRENAVYIQSIADQTRKQKQIDIALSSGGWAPVAIKEHHHKGCDYDKQLPAMQQWIDSGELVKFEMQG